VFTTLRPPGRPLSPGAIGHIVGSACQAAGLDRIGAHRLRHTLATAMLQAGASLPEVGQVLRHRSPSISSKRVTPHTLRHTAAMALLHAGVDTSVIALWLGHQSPVTTHIYLHADMTIKERALARVPATNTIRGRYRPADDLINFLERL
jgi:integrase